MFQRGGLPEIGGVAGVEEGPPNGAGLDVFDAGEGLVPFPEYPGTPKISPPLTRPKNRGGGNSRGGEIINLAIFCGSKKFSPAARILEEQRSSLGRAISPM